MLLIDYSGVREVISESVMFYCTVVLMTTDWYIE